ncbi:MAG: glycosyltransferase [Thermoguttaceae bacterium]|nr:glycosyltransferase [Thermoguttaceae bacterium]
MSESRPKISVIIPVYNVENYLRECLDSVVNQTFGDLEILCINDGSTDAGPAILEEYARKDARIRIINQENRGLAGARNTGLRHFTGEYLIFLDSDDYWELETCEKLLKKAESTGADMVQFRYDSFGESTFYKPEMVEVGDVSSPVDKIRMDHLVPNVWLYLFRGDFLRKNELQFHEELLFEDVPFTRRSRFLANKIVCLPRVFYHYRLGTGYSTHKSSDRNYLRYAKAFNGMIEDLKTSGASPEVLRIVTLRKLNEVYFAWTVKKSIRGAFTRQIREDLLPEERALIFETSELPLKKRLFYRAVAGGAFQRLIYGLRFRLLCAWDWFVERLYYRSSLSAEHAEERAWLRDLVKSLEDFLARQEEEK